MRTLKHVGTEMALHVLAYNMEVLRDYDVPVHAINVLADLK